MVAWFWRGAIVWTVLSIGVAAPAAYAQAWDPTAAVSAYSTALNTHDLSAALALFDEHGSATDAAGHHFEGSADLATFLQSSGFAAPDAHITTQDLHIVGNRAVWRYQCSCAIAPTEVRLVMIHDKISVFAIMAPPVIPQPRAAAGPPPWLLGLLLAGAAVLGIGFSQRRSSPTIPPPRGNQGRLLAALLESRHRSPLGTAEANQPLADGRMPQLEATSRR